MTYCYNEGCRCSCRAGVNSRNLGSSYKNLKICVCCALELFPKGIELEGEFFEFFHFSSRCNKQLKFEKEEKAQKKRQENKKLLTIEVKSKPGDFRKW